MDREQRLELILLKDELSDIMNDYPNEMGYVMRDRDMGEFDEGWVLNRHSVVTDDFNRVIDVKDKNIKVTSTEWKIVCIKEIISRVEKFIKENPDIQSRKKIIGGLLWRD